MLNNVDIQVDVGSPAELGGLREGDLIVEVNGTAVIESARCSHDQLAGRIMMSQGRVELLVVDSFTERWCRYRGLSFTADKDRRQVPIVMITDGQRTPISTQIEGH